MRVKTLIRSLRSERGVALPVSVAVLMAAGALAGAAAMAAMDANSQSSRDKFVKRAVAAADGGIEVALFRNNKFATVLDATNQCVVKSPTTGAMSVEPVQGDGWCRAQTETFGEGESFSYRVSGRQQVMVGAQSVWQRKIVSTGLMSGVQRRAATTLNAPTGTPLFIDGVFSDLDLVMKGNSRIDANVYSNGNIVTQNPATICGNAVAGPGKSVKGKGNICPGASNQVATEPIVLSPVVVPTTGVDGNPRLTAGDSPKVTPTWNAGNRRLDMDGKDELTLGGNVYVLCNLTFNNTAEIHIPDDGTPVKIYIDAPERCGGYGNINFQQSAGFDNESENPVMLQIYVAGSKNIPTSVTFNNMRDMEAAIYAPNSTVSFENQTSFKGSVMGKQVKISNKTTIEYDSRVAGVMAGDVPLQVYKRQSWTECNAKGGSAPDSGC